MERELICRDSANTSIKENGGTRYVGKNKWRTNSEKKAQEEGRGASGTPATKKGKSRNSL